MTFSGFTVTLARPLDDATVDAVRQALGQQGFGVLSDIDVAGALRAKLGVDRPPLRILGACNPAVADEALRRDPSVALVLPCNVVLEGGGETTRVTAADPRSLLTGPDLAGMADEAAALLEAAIAHLRDAPPAAARVAPAAAGTTADPGSELGVAESELGVAAELSAADPHRPVRAVATLSPVYGLAHDTLRRVAERLTEDGIGIVLLRRPGGLGAVSERDVVRALANGADPDVIWAEDVMSEHLVTADAEDRIVDTAAELVDRGIRHAPVLDGDHVIGVVSLRDLTAILVDAALGAYRGFATWWGGPCEVRRAWPASSAVGPGGRLMVARWRPGQGGRGLSTGAPGRGGVDRAIPR